ncbi:MAG: serine hydrolase domain-containing protein [Sporichthyaceae bacterium]
MDGSKIDEMLAGAVASGAAPNVVAMVADRGGVRYLGAAGPRTADSPAGGDVGPDSVYRIASMTKPVATVAALQLAESGALDLDAPVGDYLPEFDQLRVLTGFDGDTPRFRAPATRATLRHLATHTAGLAYNFFNPEQRRWQEVTGTPSILTGSRAILGSPLHTDPGTRWEYSIGTDWLGLAVEAVSGTDLDAYCRAHICEPLGMSSTRFAADPAMLAAAVPVHTQDEAGRWTATDFELPAGPAFWAGGTSLYSTPSDYLRFARMLLGDGELDGVRVLAPATVATAFADQIAPLEIPTVLVSLDHGLTGDFLLPPGWGFGLGFALNKIDLPGMRRAYSGSWGGIFNTGFWVDRTAGVTGAIFTQCLPGSRAEFRNLGVGFELATYAALA